MSIKKVYDPMLKTFREVKTKDAKVNGKEAEWFTENGQHIAVGEGGELVAGNPKVVGGAKKVNSAKEKNVDPSKKTSKHVEYRSKQLQGLKTRAEVKKFLENLYDDDSAGMFYGDEKEYEQLYKEAKKKMKELPAKEKSNEPKNKEQSSNPERYRHSRLYQNWYSNINGFRGKKQLPEEEWNPAYRIELLKQCQNGINKSLKSGEISSEMAEELLGMIPKRLNKAKKLYKKDNGEDYE